MSNNRSTFRMRRGAVVAAAAFGSLVIGGAATWAADGGEALNSSSNVGQPAIATQQAKRLSIDATKPIFPMQVSPTCHILDNFGDPRSGGRTHEGTDIMADRDQPKYNQEVYAVVDGTLSHQVIDGTPDASLSGNSWHLDVAGSKTKTYYAYMHLARFAPGLSNGSFVSQGQLIGYVGDTGDPGPGNYHLHFEVHPKGEQHGVVNALTVLTVPSGCTVQ
jgi:murein DD-endopeptidase MepM/ murein hydrolase activator NlpD